LNKPTIKDRSELEEALLQASRLVDDGDEPGALRFLLELEREHSRDATLLCMIGVIAEHLGAEGMAVDYYRRCLAEEPTDPALLVPAGAGLAATGDPAAEPALRLAALTAPVFAPARLHYGSFLVRTGLLAEGLEELAKARELDPTNVAVYRETAVAHLLAGRPSEAVEELEMAVAQDPEDAELRFLYGLILLHQGETARAAEELHPASEGLAEDGEAQLVLALAFGLEDWLDEAWLAVSRAETALEPAVSEMVREVEEALETGEEAIREMLLTELGPSALRSRIHTG
jgi:tetratricopeptide (TPR) repeat protein